MAAVIPVCRRETATLDAVAAALTLPNEDTAAVDAARNAGGTWPAATTMRRVDAAAVAPACAVTAAEAAAARDADAAAAAVAADISDCIPAMAALDVAAAAFTRARDETAPAEAARKAAGTWPAAVATRSVAAAARELDWAMLVAAARFAAAVDATARDALLDASCIEACMRALA